jgi:hypothetical protein
MSALKHFDAIKQQNEFIETLIVAAQEHMYMSDRRMRIEFACMLARKIRCSIQALMVGA